MFLMQNTIEKLPCRLSVIFYLLVERTECLKEGIDREPRKSKEMGFSWQNVAMHYKIYLYIGK